MSAIMQKFEHFCHYLSLGLEWKLTFFQSCGNCCVFQICWHIECSYMKKDVHDPDNHDGVITHLDPDILESKVKWALGSIATNKANGGDGIPAELFQILKDESVKVCTQHDRKFGKLSSGHRTGKGQFSFQCQRKSMPKNVQITA